MMFQARMDQAKEKWERLNFQIVTHLSCVIHFAPRNRPVCSASILCASPFFLVVLLYITPCNFWKSLHFPAQVYLFVVVVKAVRFIQSYVIHFQPNLHPYHRYSLIFNMTGLPRLSRV